MRHKGVTRGAAERTLRPQGVKGSRRQSAWMTPGCAARGVCSLCCGVQSFLIRCLFGKSFRAKTSREGRFLAGPFQSGTTTKEVKERTRLTTTKQRTPAHDKSGDTPERERPHTDLRSRTWPARTPGWVDLPSGRSYRKSLQSQTTAKARCHPFFTPLGLGICRSK